MTSATLIPPSVSPGATAAALLSAFPAAMAVVGLDLRFHYANPAMTRLLGARVGEGVEASTVLLIPKLVRVNDHAFLADDTLVATVMSNLGLIRAMQEHGISVVQAGVGDRYVLEEMRKGGYSLGGEQSGHVILQEHATTGDGVLTGLMLAARVAETGKSIAELGSVMARMPQVLINVKGVDKDRVDGDEGVQKAVSEVSSALGDDGRVLLRKSGTEPVVRVMVEADTHERAQESAERLSVVVRERLSL